MLGYGKKGDGGGSVGVSITEAVNILAVLSRFPQGALPQKLVISNADLASLRIRFVSTNIQ